MQLQLLGPVEARVDGRAVPLGGAKQRSVLAMLALEANRTVSADRLIEGLWGEHAPASAGKMVQNYVWRLRTALSEDLGVEIATRGRGYELRIDEDSVDARRFERLLAQANRATRDGEASRAAREALGLWRGKALADVADEPFAASEINRLDELRVEAAELAIAADLAAGRHHELVGEIEALVAEHPLRESLHAHRMLALYRCGRQAEALEAYRKARRILVEEVGLEPGPELRRLHEAILRQDSALEVEPAAGELPRELDAAGSPVLFGRDEQLHRLRQRWREAAAGAGALVTLTGRHGMGKTRLAMELAGEAHRDGATVLYASGLGRPEPALGAVAAIRGATRPTLLVVDDADRASASVHAELLELAPSLPGAPTLVVVTASDATAVAGLQAAEEIALEPLGTEAVRAIAESYGGPADVEVPAENLAAASGGVPRRVHEAAGEWARREATRRVAAATRAVARWTEARALVADLAGTVVELQTARERSELAASDPRGPADAVACPYKGLASFQPGDAELFFGRERLVAAMVARLVGEPLLGVVGPSGSGKSSVVRAGLLPALASGILPGSESWSRFLMRPGEHPMRELHRVADHLGAGRLVIAVDQFEEVFTACRDEQEREAFVSALVRAVDERDGHAVIVLAIRADFYGRCARYPELARLLAANQVLVGPMSGEELRRAIVSPAQRVGLVVEPQLVDTLIADVKGQPGALPLLSTALLELWQRRRGRRLTLSAYQATGGVHGAVARLAEDAYLALDEGDRAMTRNVMLRLAGEGEGGGVVRRRVQLGELEHASELVHALAGRRLLTISEGTVEVAHEALLSEWPRLRSWLEDDVEGRRLHRHISEAAREWDAERRDPALLYRGARLSAALEWRAGHEGELNERERAFLEAARLAGQRAHRRLQMVLAAVAALLLVAVGAGIVALDQRAHARAEALTAEAQRLGAQALTTEELDRSLLLARQAVALEDSPATRGTLLSALVRSPAAVKVLRGVGGRMLSVGVHPDGRRIAAGDNRGRLLVYDVAAGRSLGVRYETGLPIHAVRFSPDGNRLVLTSANQGGTALDLLDGRTFRRIAHRRLPPMGQLFGSVAFAPDSRTFITAYEPLAQEPPWDGVLRRWSAKDGRSLRSRRFAGVGSLSVNVTAGGRLVTVSEAADETVIRDARTLEPIRRVAGGGLPWASTVTPDGQLAALGRDDGSVRLVDLRTGRSHEAAGRHDVSVQGAAFTPDGRWLLTVGDDARVRIRPVAGPGRVETFEGHAGRIAGLALSPDGRTAYTASLDGTVIVWDLGGARRFGRVFSPDPPAGDTIPGASLQTGGDRGYVSEELGYNFGSTPAGAVVAIGRPGGDVHLVDTRTLRFVRRLHAIDGAEVVGVEFAPDGRTLAVTGQDGSVRLWDANTGRPISPRLVAAAGRWEWSPSFSADGRWLATAGLDGGVRLWDARGHQLVRQRRYHGMLPADVALRPDGKVLVVPVSNGPATGGVDVLSVPRLERLRRIDMTWARVARFSADGRLLALTDNEGRAQIYDGRTFAPHGRALTGHAGAVFTADFSPDERLLATSSTDGTVRLWDVATGSPIGAPLPGLANLALGAAFVRGGTHLAAVHGGGRGYLWDVRPTSWERRACHVAGRPLTPQEWQEALPGREYEPACSS